MPNNVAALGIDIYTPRLAAFFFTWQKSKRPAEAGQENIGCGAGIAMLWPWHATCDLANLAKKQSGCNML